ncbi:ABC transporter permease [Sediminitomix flava]|uniref:ABC-type lipoprotein release transport system permease subunit n=1 Tax=Sediminitomix flava TaxID=379075 RepID=A0A315ZG67_SEDFL|nr:FtsX-like permease family protein [Sediminitomix flava]PWJ44585.1 ABC-type lipoprotein release transport system permease subunit [Sediminitomix flava]
MSLIAKMAWRNVWRNRRRTIISVASICMAVILSVFMRSLQKGGQYNMAKVTIEQMGHIQLHKEGYWKDKSINELMPQSEEQEKKLKAYQEVRQIIPRLDAFALSVSEKTTQASFVTGIEPEKERNFTELDERIVEGKFLDSNSQGVMIAQGLADYLQMGIGDTLVLWGSGYHAQQAAGKYPIEGILKLSNPELNRMAVYLPLEQAQELFSAYGLVSAYLLDLDVKPQGLKVSKDLLTFQEHLKSSFGADVEVMNWAELAPDMVQSLEFDDIGGIVMVGILYIIIAFGIYGTLMMMTMERGKEFGVLVGVGMSKWKLAELVTIESLILAVLGLGISLAVSIPLVHHFFVNPIELTGEAAKQMELMGMDPLIPTILDFGVVLIQVIIIFTIVMLSLSYPFYKIVQLRVAEALKG